MKYLLKISSLSLIAKVRKTSRSTVTKHKPKVGKIKCKHCTGKVGRIFKPGLKLCFSNWAVFTTRDLGLPPCCMRYSWTARRMKSIRLSRLVSLAEYAEMELVKHRLTEHFLKAYNVTSIANTTPTTLKTLYNAPSEVIFSSPWMMSSMSWEILLKGISSIGSCVGYEKFPYGSMVPGAMMINLVDTLGPVPPQRG